MADFISIDVRGNREIAAKLKALPPQAVRLGTESAVQFIAQTFNRYAANAAYNYVPFSAVGGFFSDRQRRFVMASISNGQMIPPYSRKSGDHFHVKGRGASAHVVSDRVSMFYSMNDENQARLQQMRGWAKVGELLDANRPEIVKAFDLGVADAVRMMNAQFSEEMSQVAP